HRISGRAAATNLPVEMPAFFREAAAQLEYLNPEPDRWRSRDFPELDNAHEFEHYIDLEIVPDSALQAPDRFTYLEMLARGGLDDAADRAGLLPFRILELYQRLTVGFADWRAAPDEATRAYIEQRIINDAGILGHYVSDGANPHHATIHFNGWADGAPNPRGFTTDRTFHRRFESDFVGAHVTLGELLPHVSNWPGAIGDAHTDVVEFLRASNAQVERLYELEQLPFETTTVSMAHERFAIDRLVAGIEMLRSLWWSAWQRSASLE
ncbi:MAG: hypothetical protein ACRELX_10890, partial [Longimicrobiales bacterium]